MTSLEESLRALGFAPKGVGKSNTRKEKAGETSVTRSGPRGSTEGERTAAGLTDASSAYQSPYRPVCPICEDLGCKHCESMNCVECHGLGCSACGVCDSCGTYNPRCPECEAGLAINASSSVLAGSGYNFAEKMMMSSA